MNHHRIGCARPEQYEDILAHIDAAFGFEPGYFLAHYPSHWRPEFFDCDNILIAEEGGRIASLLRLFPRELIQGGVTLPAVGIGTVCTAPWARGRGYMSGLLEHSNVLVRQRGYTIAYLCGDRHRYATFGYCPAGRSIHLQVGARGLRAAGIALREPLPCGGEAGMLARISALYDDLPYRRKRPPEEMPWIYAASGHTVYVSHADAGAADFAYLVLHGATVAEFGGDQETALALAHSACAASGQSLRYSFADANAIGPALLAAASHWCIEPFAQGQVLDAPAIAMAIGAVRNGFDSARFLGLIPRVQAEALFGGLNEGAFNLHLPFTDRV